ncbi:MAG: isochorismatase family protein [Comamonas sp.]
MLMDEQDSQLVLIDYQPRLMAVIQGAPEVLANAGRLAQAARALAVPVWGTEQNPQRLGELPPELREHCRKVLPKLAFSAVAEGLADWLRPPAKPAGGNARSLPKHLQKPAPQAAGNGRNAIVLAGCETHICVLQTALELLEDEFEVWVVTDACGSRTDRNRDAAFDRLAGAGAELVTTEMVIFEWLQSAEHPEFKTLQALVR